MKPEPRLPLDLPILVSEPVMFEVGFDPAGVLRVLQRAAVHRGMMSEADQR
ncbi:hypothetical protein WMF31_38110 [Sorangium sp. So ce1036]|uniref:hypothetical protein n=1 Tax=Sorangium sp. So ce1036 TaxID=3133328 RepID=UPI003F0D61D7